MQTHAWHYWPTSDYSDALPAPAATAAAALQPLPPSPCAGRSASTATLAIGPRTRLRPIAAYATAFVSSASRTALERPAPPLRSAPASWTNLNKKIFMSNPACDKGYDTPMQQREDSTTFMPTFKFDYKHQCNYTILHRILWNNIAVLKATHRYPNWFPYSALRLNRTSMERSIKLSFWVTLLQ